MAKDYAGEEEILIKVFYEEIRPLGHLARHKYLGKPGVFLRPKIGNQNYDAEIISTASGEERIQRVEFTSTYRNYDLALRMEHLAQQGGAFMTGSVWRDGNGQVQIHPEFVDHQILLDTLFATCDERVANKVGKDYAPGTLLAIVFDESILYPTDIPSIAQYFRDTLSKQALSGFCGGFILGAAGRIFLEFGETDP
ncbi:MAG: hypothetical protein ACREJN_12505 [Nitrospiraceae bacterium]